MMAAPGPKAVWRSDAGWRSGRRGSSYPAGFVRASSEGTGPRDWRGEGHSPWNSEGVRRFYVQRVFIVDTTPRDAYTLSPQRSCATVAGEWPTRRPRGGVDGAAGRRSATARWSARRDGVGRPQGMVESLFR